VTGILAVGATEITVTESAITMGVNSSDPDDAVYQAPTDGVVTIPAAGSNQYYIYAYETVEKQAKTAFDKLKAEIVDDWVVQKAALAKETPFELSASGSNLAPYYDGNDTITLYYVVSRLNPPSVNQFQINVPQFEDPRWIFTGPWELTNGKTAIADAPAAAKANTGDEKIINYRPYGGTLIPFKIIWKPVLEFYVSFVEAEDYDYDTGSLVTIKDDVTGSSGVSNTFNVGNSSDALADAAAKQYKLGNTTITLANVTITINYTNPGGAPGDYFPAAAASMPTDTAGALTNGDILQSGSKENILLESREYQVNVYRTIAKQKKDAIAEIRGQTAFADKWASKVAGNVFHPNGLKSVGDADTDKTSELIYAGTEPTISIRDDTAGGTLTTPGLVDWHDKGWTAVTTPNKIPPTAAADNNPDTYGSRISLISFTPKGGVVEDDIYRIKTIPAALYNVSYKNLPISKTITSGTVTVQGALPGDTSATSGPIVTFTAQGVPPTPEQPTSSSSYWIGKGSNITVKATSAAPNQNYLSNTVGATSVASSATGEMTIAAAQVTSVITPIVIEVYPSKEAQTADFLSNMRKIDKTGLKNWISGLTDATSIKDNASPNGTNNDTSFQVVGLLAASTSSGLQVAVPTGFLDAAYSPVTDYIVPDNATNGGTIASPTAVANGNKTVKITFTPKSAGTPPADDVFFTFNLTAVAKYNVEIMEAPTGGRNYGVDLIISTWDPGNAGDDITVGKNIIPVSQDRPRATYYGGIGTFTNIDGGPTNNITAPSSNVFSVDDATTGAGAATTAVSLATVTSKEYNIRIYPRVADQIEMVERKLDTYYGKAAAEWFNNEPTLVTANFAAKASTTGTKILEIQYLEKLTNSSSAKVPQVQLADSFGLVTGDYYAYTLAPFTATSPDANTGVDTVPLRFTPMGGSAGNTYSIRRIPVVKYTVTYARGATGSVLITPTVDGTKPAGPLTINTAGTYYLGRGATGFKMSSTRGSFDYATYNVKGVNTSTTFATENPNGGESTEVVSFNPDSVEYEITVIKN